MKITPYPKNAKKHPERQIELIANSIERFGWQQPIVVDKDGTIIVGHGRWLAYKSRENLPEPWVTDNEGNTISGKQGKKLDAKEIRAYRLADNKIAESDWDMDLVIEELLDFEKELIELSGFSLDLLTEKENPYTTKVSTPTYEARGEKPETTNLVDVKKMNELLEEIERADISEQDKQFLRLASYRHIVFDYSKIAEFYIQSDKKVQELMEKSALVIIDYDKAIENGYVELSKLLAKIQDDEE